MIYYLMMCLLFKIYTLYLFLSCADGGNFLWKKFHKTSHTLHSLITCKLNLKRVNSLYTYKTDYKVVILSDSVPQGYPTSYGSLLAYDVSKESSLLSNFTAQTTLVLMFVSLTSYCSFCYRGDLTP